MDDLFERYSRIEKSYYRIPVSANTLFVGCDANYNCRSFISEHFEKGNKKGVFHIFREFTHDYETKGKHLHTVSLYLLGLSLEDTFSRPLKRKLSELIENMAWYDFKYSWYLTCLYHDVTSCIETNSEYSVLCDAVEGSSLFTHTPIKKDAQLLRFPKRVITDYLEYRKNDGKNDHGIIAGAQLFDRLSQSFKEKTAGHDWAKSPEYNLHHLHWRREHLDHFAYIADAVCCHNIWLATPETEEEYHNANLDELIVHNDCDKLCIDTYPLQFMLCLLDTIEPVKRFHRLSAEAVLKNICIEAATGAIKITWNQIIKTQPEFYVWLSGIRTLCDWMNVRISPCQCNGDLCSITITIRP